MNIVKACKNLLFVERNDLKSDEKYTDKIGFGIHSRDVLSRNRFHTVTYHKVKDLDMGTVNGSKRSLIHRLAVGIIFGSLVFFTFGLALMNTDVRVKLYEAFTGRKVIKSKTKDMTYERIT